MKKKSPRVSQKVENRQSASEKRAILVLGMHRSGTSALTRLLGLLGADLPKNQMGRHSSNEAGHWESQDLFRLHEEMLNSVGSNWQDWRAFDSDWFQSDAAKSYKARALQVLADDFATSRLFVVKDPRICRFVPFWLAVFNDFRARPFAVLPVRNPIEVAASLKERNGLSREKSLLLWLRHVLDAEKDSRETARAVTAFETMITDWPRLVSTISRATGLQWPRDVAEARGEIEEFLTPRLRHHVVPHARLSDDRQIAKWVKETYDLMLALTKNANHKGSLESLDRIRTEFDEATAMFGPTFAAEQGALRAEFDADLKTAKEDIRSGQSQAEEARRIHREELTRVNRELEAARLFLRDSQADVQRTSGELAVATDNLEALRKTYATEQGFLVRERHRLVDELNATLSDLMREREAAAKAADQLKAAQQKVDADDKRIGQLERDLAEQRQQLAKAADQIKAAEKKMEADDRVIERLKQDLSAAQRDFEREQKGHASALKAEREQFSEIKRAFEQARADGDRTRRELREETTQLRGILDRQAAEMKELIERQSTWAPLRWLGEKLSAPRRAATRRRTIAVIAASGLFDAEYYLEQNPDVAEAGADPIRHFVEFGAREGRRPHRLFDPTYYLDWNPDVAASGDNPLEHYIVHGAYEGRDPHPLFDSDWYLTQYPKVAEAKLLPLAHYLNQGAAEGCNPNPLFDSTWYTERNPEVIRSKINPLIHYMTDGAAAGREPHPLFDGRWYLEQHPDLADSGASPLEHYLLEKNAAKRPAASAKARR